VSLHRTRDVSSEVTLEEFRQLSTERRVVIVDDYHKLPLKAEDRHAFLTSLADFASRVILIADTIVVSTRNLFYPNGLPRGPIPFAPYRILRFGHVNRDALVQKWMRLNADPGCVAYARELATIHRTIDTLIGRNFVPAFPYHAPVAGSTCAGGRHVHARHTEANRSGQARRGSQPGGQDLTAAISRLPGYQSFMGRADERSGTRGGAGDRLRGGDAEHARPGALAAHLPRPGRVRLRIAAVYWR
jgi:hypothetical protein